jgi:co-chaperonin GroES (HSP10)
MITPLGKRVIVRPLIDKQSGSIAIPDQFVQSSTAEVVGIGTKMPDGLDIGDTVLLHPNAAWTNIEHEGEQLRVVVEEYLLAIMEKA